MKSCALYKPAKGNSWQAFYSSFVLEKGRCTWMNNSHADPNISLGLNFLEGIRVANVGLNHKPFGLDIGHRNVHDLFRCAFRTVAALRDKGITGIYYQLPMMYYAYLMEKEMLPSYWDSGQEPQG